MPPYRLAVRFHNSITHRGNGELRKRSFARLPAETLAQVVVCEQPGDRLGERVESFTGTVRPVTPSRLA